MSRSVIWGTPFLDDSHRALADRLLAWDIPDVGHDPTDFGPPVRLMLKAMAAEGLLERIVPTDPQKTPIDVRAICLIREILAYRSGGLADTAFVMQGIGTGALWLSGCGAMAADHLDRARRGEAIATATPMCSTAPRPSSPTPASPTSMCSSPAPAKRPARGD
jgi:acyl-CoA dehydrogenase